ASCSTSVDPCQNVTVVPFPPDVTSLSPDAQPAKTVVHTTVTAKRIVSIRFERFISFPPELMFTWLAFFRFRHPAVPVVGQSTPPSSTLNFVIHWRFTSC